MKCHSAGCRYRWGAWLRLGLCAGAIGGVWLGVLPYIGRSPGIDSYIQRNERLGIDPSAKFYTELPLMPNMLDRVETKQRRGGYFTSSVSTSGERSSERH